MSASLFPHTKEDVGLETQPQASWACKLRSPVCCITQKPSSYVSGSNGLNKIGDDAFLAGHFCALIQTGYKIYCYIEYVTRKQMDSLTFQANQPHFDELYICFGIDPFLPPYCPS